MLRTLHGSLVADGEGSRRNAGQTSELEQTVTCTDWYLCRAPLPPQEPIHDIPPVMYAFYLYRCRQSGVDPIQPDGTFYFEGKRYRKPSWL